MLIALTRTRKIYEKEHISKLQNITKQSHKGPLRKHFTGHKKKSQAFSHLVRVIKFCLEYQNYLLLTSYLNLL